MGAIIDKIKGKAKKLEGKATGDKVRTAQGSFDDTKGDTKGAVERASTRVKAGARRVKGKLQRGTSRTRANARTR